MSSASTNGGASTKASGRQLTPRGKKEEDQKGKSKAADKEDCPRHSDFLIMKVLTPEGLEAIANHKYVGGKYTPLDNLLNPWWYWLTNLLPEWLAPNLVTFSGLWPLMVLYSIQWYVNPTGQEPSPSWVLFAGSGCLWMYQTLDAMDGKQARRTNSSTPLGQLFDHGCDALVTMGVHAMAMALFHPGGSMLAMLALTVLMSGFLLAQWEEYHTGILQTAVGPVGVTETQYSLMIAQFIAAFQGPDRLAKFVGSTVPVLGFDIAVKDLVVIAWCFFVGMLILLCWGRVFPRTWKTKGQTWKAVKQLCSLTLLNVAAISFKAEFRMASCRLLFLATGLHFFYVTCQLIIFSMAHQHFSSLKWSVFLYTGLSIGSHVLEPDLMEKVMMAHTCIFGIYVLAWIRSCVVQICTKLKIRIFHIKAGQFCMQSKIN